MIMIEEQLRDITIFSDEEYTLSQISASSDMDNSVSSLGLNEQLALVEKKYRKYKTLRNKLLYQLNNSKLNIKDQQNKQTSSESENISSSLEQMTEDNNLITQDPQNTQKVLLVPTLEMLNRERIKFIRLLKEDNPDISFNEICIQLNNRNDLKENKFGKFKQIKISTIKKLVEDLNINQTSRYLHPERNSHNVAEMRHIFCKKFLKKMEQNVTILFIDQYTFKLPPSQKEQPYNKNEAIVIESNRYNKGIFSLLTCFSLAGQAYFKISQAQQEKYDDYQGFCNLIEQASEDLGLNKTQQSASSVISEKSQDIAKQICLIMDHAIIRNVEKQKKYRQLTKAKLLFLPYHSPQLNPIDSWFQILRQKIRKSNFLSKEQLCKGIHYILKEHQNYNYKAIVEESIQQIKRGQAYGRF